jgi:hypothetical protein
VNDSNFLDCPKGRSSAGDLAIGLLSKPTYAAVLALRICLFRSPTPMLSTTAGTSSGRPRLRDRLCSRLNEGAQTHPRYNARDFERRWQTRLNTPPRRTTNNSSQLHVEVTHRFPAPNRYSWELRPVTGLSVEESRVQFASWEEASQAGKLALNQFLQHP